MTGLLVFAVVPDGRLDAATLADGDGLPPGLRLVAAAGLAAVVGPAPEGGLKGRDRAALMPWLLAGQTVMERLLARTPVLPVALGTVVEDDDRVRRLLERGAGVLRDAFDALGGRYELDLTVRWSLDAVVARLLPDVRPELRRAAEAGDAAARQALGAALGRLVAAERQAVRRRVVAHLGAVAYDLIVTEPAEPEAVAGLAMLVDRDAEPALDRALEALDAEFDGRLALRLVGPLAPVSFASVQVHLAPAEAVEAARAALGVAPEAGPDALKAAYRRALREVHPDRVAHQAEADPAAAGGEGGDGARFLALSAAYRLLQAELAPVALRRQDAAPP